MKVVILSCQKYWVSTLLCEMYNGGPCSSFTKYASVLRMSLTSQSVHANDR